MRDYYKENRDYYREMEKEKKIFRDDGRGGANAAIKSDYPPNWPYTFNEEEELVAFIPDVKSLPKIEYKFNEAKILEEIKQYIDKTYSAHYSQTKLQAFEEILDNGYGLGFAMGNVTKYNKRFGKKAGKNRDDLLKQIHYAILALYAHDYESEE